jgi:hypothetical protein
MIGGVQSDNQKEQYDVPTQTTARSPKELGREGYSDLQGQLHKHIV